MFDYRFVTALLAIRDLSPISVELTPPWIFCSSAPAVSGHSGQVCSRWSGPRRSTSANPPRALDEEHLCCVYLRDAAGEALNALGTHRANLPPTDVDLVRRSMGLNIEQLVACLKQLLGVKVFTE